MRQVGQTKDVGFQFGLRKTLSISSESMWEFLFSENGLRIWLGKLKSEFGPDQNFETENGITGSFRVFNPKSHFRINWKKENWVNTSTVQIRVIGNQERSTLAIHQEKLLGPEQRSEMKVHWNAVMGKIVKELTKISRK